MQEIFRVIQTEVLSERSAMETNSGHHVRIMQNKAANLSVLIPRPKILSTPQISPSELSNIFFKISNDGDSTAPSGTWFRFQLALTML